MKPDAVEKLQLCKSKDKFPIENWEERGLIVSSVNIREDE